MSAVSNAPPMRLLTLIAATLTAVTSASAQSRTADTCGSQKNATISLAWALDDVRAARLYAETVQRRTALADLETMIVEQLEAEPDSVLRQFAWTLVGRQLNVAKAEKGLARIERIAAEQIKSDSLATAFLAEQRTSHYRESLEAAAGQLDPRLPNRCASARWRRLHAAALKAGAL